MFNNNTVRVNKKLLLILVTWAKHFAGITSFCPLKNPWGSFYYYPHSAEEETKAEGCILTQGSEVASGELDFDLRLCEFRVLNDSAVDCPSPHKKEFTLGHL